MSMQTFQTQLSSMMELLLREAVGQIMMLAETTFADFQVPAAGGQKENHYVMQRLQLQESGMGTNGDGRAAHSAQGRSVGVQVSLQHRRETGTVENVPLEGNLFDMEWSVRQWEHKQLTSVEVKEEATEKFPASFREEVTELKSAPVIEEVIGQSESCPTAVNNTNRASGLKSHLADNLEDCQTSNLEQQTPEGSADEDLSAHVQASVKVSGDPDTAERITMGQQHFKEELDYSLQQDFDPTPKGENTVQHRSSQTRVGCGLQSVHMAQPGPHHGLSLLGDLQPAGMNEESTDSERHRPCIESFYVKPESSVLEVVHTKDEGVLWSAGSIENSEEFNSTQKAKCIEYLEGRTLTMTNIRQQELRKMLRCFVRLERLQLLCHRQPYTEKPSSPHALPPVSEKTQEKMVTPPPRNSIHQQTFLREKTDRCAQRRKACYQQVNLSKHKRFHAGEKLYTCIPCGKRFKKQSNLYSHQRIHTNEKLFICVQCGKRFKKQSNLYNHQKIHTAWKLYTCAQCEKRFRSLSNLYRHQRIHTTEKLFTCAQCGKRFRKQSRLYRHQMIHSGEKPYSCAKCGKSFRKQSSLNKHGGSHLGQES